MLPLGRVGRPHGTRGEVAFHPFNDAGDAVLDALEPPIPVSLVTAGGVRDAVVLGIRPANAVWLLRLEGVTDRDQAAALTHAEVQVARDRLPPLDEGEFYVEDLSGCRVLDEQGATLGTAEGSYWNGAHDVLTIRTEDGRERLVPLVPEFVVSVDTEKRVVVMTPPAEADET